MYDVLLLLKLRFTGWDYQLPDKHILESALGFELHDYIRFRPKVSSAFTRKEVGNLHDFSLNSFFFLCADVWQSCMLKVDGCGDGSRAGHGRCVSPLLEYPLRRAKGLSRYGGRGWLNVC